MEYSQARILFMGSPDFAVPALKSLAVDNRVVCVVTQPDRPSGRGRSLRASPVKETALEFDLPLIQPEKLNTSEIITQLRDYQLDLIVVAAYGQILRKDILDLAPFGCVNIHASLLPRWRGAAPIQACILAGDEFTGITIMKMDVGVDTGPILSQKSIPIESCDTGGSLFEKLAPLGGDLLMETLPGYLSGKVIPQPQDSELATYAPMLKKEHGLLDFNEPAEVLERKVRAFNPWPGTYLKADGKAIKIHNSHVEPGNQIAGKHLVVNGLPAIATKNGILVLDVVQPPGKKPMPGKAFLSGARDWTNN